MCPTRHFVYIFFNPVFQVSTAKNEINLFNNHILIVAPVNFAPAGVMTPSTEFLSSYLLERKQKVFVNKTLSVSEYILCGVPQGSILGPLLFLIFTNYVPLHIDNVLTDLYADYTTLYYTGRLQACIEQQLQATLHKLLNWCKQNGMLINFDKTHFNICRYI